MKKFYTGFVCLLVSLNIHAQTTIAAETFENATPLFTPAGIGLSFVSGATAGIVQPNGVNYAAEGTYGLAITGNTGGGPPTLTSGAISTAGFTNIELSMRVSAYALNASGGLDALDRVRIAISTDGGSFFQDLLYVQGAGNSYWSYAATGIATTAYPTTITVAASTVGFNGAGPSTMIITNLPSVTDLRIRIGASASINNERWVIDDLKLTGDISLPITLLSFNSKIQDNHPLLKWEIAAAEDGFQYEVQRSEDGNHFTTVNTQTGDASTTRFEYLDAITANDHLYYKLRMTDIDGKITFSNILHLVPTGNTNKVALLYPNIIKDKATLRLNENEPRGLTARLVNMSGATVRSYQIKSNFELIDLSGVASGIYVLALSNGTKFKLLKE